MTDTQTRSDPQERGGASVDVDRLSQIKRRIREWRSYDAATQNDDQDWLVAEVERLQADLAQARADTDDLVANAWDAAKAGIDQLTQERDQVRAENQALRALIRDCVTEIQELMRGTTLLSWSVPQALAALDGKAQPRDEVTPSS